MCDLLEALDCENEEVVINAFIDRYSISRDEAEEIFTETKKWLWLAARTMNSGPHNLFIDKPLSIIDEMWHNFILHTKYYYDYCMSKFHHLIHHYPTTPEEKTEFKKQLKKNPSLVHKKNAQLVKKQYDLIYDYLGPETLVKWYDQLASKYTEEYIKSIRKY